MCNSDGYLYDWYCGTDPSRPMYQFYFDYVQYLTPYSYLTYHWDDGYLDNDYFYYDW
jgi:hypothetical protein